VTSDVNNTARFSMLFIISDENMLNNYCRYHIN